MDLASEAKSGFRGQGWSLWLRLISRLWLASQAEASLLDQGWPNRLRLSSDTMIGLRA